MVKKSNRSHRTETVKLGIGDELHRFTEETGRSVPAIMDGFSRTWRTIPAGFLEELKKEKVETVLRHIFEASEIGKPIDEQVRRSLNLEDFVLEDVEISLGEMSFFLDYEATADYQGAVDSVYVTIDKESAELRCDAAVSPLRSKDEFKTVVKGFEDGLLDRMEDFELEYDGDSESAQVSLVLTAEAYGDFPDIDDVSQMFERLRKFLGGAIPDQAR
ncbi:MAG: hypothetical protein JRN09_00235 [Nitrososphaerota archaeon]|nr:hypothetical protein [Nitrososphaerota archaeon]